jgi:hypothetical protein
LLTFPDDGRQSPVVEIEMEVRRLITPATRDVATGAMIAAGPEIDDEAGWRTYRSERPDRRYAVAKRVLSRRQLRRHGVSNAPTHMGYGHGLRTWADAQSRRLFIDPA